MPPPSTAALLREATGAEWLRGALAVYSLADEIVRRLRPQGARDGSVLMVWLTASTVAGYAKEYPGCRLSSGGDLDPDFIRWLREHPPAGGGADGEELRRWIRDYLI